MPTNKDKIRDLKPNKDAKGGGGKGATQGGGGATQGGGGTRGIDASIILPPGGGKSGKIEDPSHSLEGGSGIK